MSRKLTLRQKAWAKTFTGLNRSFDIKRLIAEVADGPKLAIEAQDGDQQVSVESELDQWKARRARSA